MLSYSTSFVAYCFGWGLKKLKGSKCGYFLKGFVKIGPIGFGSYALGTHAEGLYLFNLGGQVERLYLAKIGGQVEMS